MPTAGDLNPVAGRFRDAENRSLSLAAVSARAGQLAEGISALPTGTRTTDHAGSLGV